MNENDKKSIIAENLVKIKQTIALAAEKSGRNPKDITLVAVTKTIEPQYLIEAQKLGINHFGENRAQEMLTKMQSLENNPEFSSKDAQWHMIGHIQRNKIKMIADKVSMIHSLDSFRLAEEIGKFAKSREIIVDVLIEINIANEPSKFGISPMDAVEFAATLQKLENIRLRGLMCVAPYVEIAERNRIYFQLMSEIMLDIKRNVPHNEYMTVLSMGMTNDYEIAIEEGAGVIRIGTGLFGGRL